MCFALLRSPFALHRPQTLRALLLATTLCGLTLSPWQPARAQDGLPTLGGTFGSIGTINLTSNNPENYLWIGRYRPGFFSSAGYLSDGVYYMQFPGGNVFGYYSYLGSFAIFVAPPPGAPAVRGYIYHFDLGYEHVTEVNDGMAGVYLYDFASNTFFYTSPSFPFPYLYDFTLNAVLYYYPDPANPGRYNTNGVRYFYNFATGQVITK